MANWIELISWLVVVTHVIDANQTRVSGGGAGGGGGRASLKMARLNWNATLLAAATPTPAQPDTSAAAAAAAAAAVAAAAGTPVTPAADCSCLPEEFSCSSRRKGQPAFTIKKSNSTSKSAKMVTAPTASPASTQCVCIPKSWLCDGNVDCDGGQDEGPECDRAPCNGVWCPRLGAAGGANQRPRCINAEWLCDGDNDCGDNSDEINCGVRNNCTETSFRCDNGNCISQKWVCDGDADCDGGSDERDCKKLATNTCQPSQHRCGNGACLPAEWKCDRDRDCSDMSDEIGCQVDDNECGPDEFQCSSGHCIKAAYRCDGEIHCSDVSDELECGSLMPRCENGNFRCPDGQCIDHSWRCDGEEDCEPGIDEENCDEDVISRARNNGSQSCGPHQMSCASKSGCISMTWVCDGEADCDDGSDESNCPMWCGKDQFTCSENVCIGFFHVCNGEKDCPGGEDELDCTFQKECDATSRCQHTCVTTSNGTNACGCRSGYQLNEDGVSCSDIDECSTERLCSQLCTNTVGAFSCSCAAGYILRPDMTSCKASGDPVRLIFANRVDIRQVSLFDEEYTSVIDGLQNAIALDFHHAKGIVIWSDVTLDAIKRAYMNGTVMSDVAWSGLKSPGGVAIDWIHDTIYWTDSGVRRIEVALLDGSVRRTLLQENVEKPRAIAVHPGRAVIVWTDWGQQPRIERADLDGSDRRVLVTDDVVWPNGLTIDYTVDHIYWADAKHHVIESVKLDGTGRRRVMDRGLPHPFAISIFEDSIFWTDWHTKSIQQANKLTGGDVRTIRTNLHFPMDIHSIHPLRQPDYPNRCGGNNGGCSHLCLPNNSGWSCFCPPGLLLTSDNRTCSTRPTELLIFAQKSELRMYPLNASGETDYVLPLAGIRSAVALDWDGESETIFWTDVEADVINRAFWNGSHQQTVIADDLESPAGVAVDWVSRKLYWTDAGTNRIEVSNLDGSLRSLLIWSGLDRPRDIVVDPIGGFMYWTDWGQTPKIERAGMDGTQRSILVTSNLTWPNGLAIDHEAERLYWADGGTKAIEYASLDGQGRTVLIGAELPHPFGLALYESWIFWSDWDTTGIHQADKLDAKRRTLVRSGLDDLMDVRVYHGNRYSVPSLCQSHNGGCSHLCLLAPLPAGHACACPTGIQLSSDGRTCRKTPATSLVFSQRSNIRQMSLDMPYSIDVVLRLPKQKNVVALDVDRRSGQIIWSDTTQDKIFRALPDGTSTADVIVYNLDTVEGLAVDEVGRKLYWTDAGRKSLEVAELDGTFRKVLVWTGLDKPRGLVLNYNKGVLLWCDWGKQPRIEQVDMDGKNRKVIVSSDLGWPNTLSIDFSASTIYWTDAKKKTIETCDFSGQNRRLVLSELSHPYGVTVLDQYIYWTDWDTKSLQRADKNTALDRLTVRSGLSNLMDVKAWKDIDASNRKESGGVVNPCGSSNGGCSHLCLRSPWGRGYSCGCPTGILMTSDGLTCQSSPNSFLLYATRNTLSSISLDTADQWDVALNVPGVHNAIGVDFHWTEQRFYYTDVYLDVIKSVDARNVSNVTTLVASNLTTPDGLAVDWLADNLYWTDAGRNVLEVSRLDGSSRRIIIGDGLDEPRAVAVFPQRGLLYWTDWGANPKIERSFMDGTWRLAIVTTELGWPNGLAIDYDGQRLYWADAQLDRIETADLSGRYRVQLVQGATHPFGLTQLGAFLYWTDWRSKSIERVDKATGKQRTVLREGLEGLMEIRAVTRDKQLGKNPCFRRNGDCSHICLFRATSILCACPDLPDPDDPCTERVVNMTLGDDYWNSDYDPSDLLPDHAASDYSDKMDKSDADDGNDARIAHPSMIVLIIVGVTALIAIITVFVWQRRRHRTCPWNSSGSRQPQQVSVLTFTNPNYSPSAPDVVAAEKKTFSWQRWKYDRNQERVYDIQDDKQSQTEAASLIPHSLPLPEVEVDLSMEAETEVIDSSSGPSTTPPPTPPERMDSICLE